MKSTFKVLFYLKKGITKLQIFSYLGKLTDSQRGLRGRGY